MRLRSLELILLTLVFVAACGDDKNMDGTTGDGTTDDTIGMSSTPTAGGTAAPMTSATGEPTTDVTTGDPTTADTTTADPTTGNPTTGDPVAPDTTLCRTFCDKRPECDLPAQDDLCMQDCLAALDLREKRCDEAATTVFECFVALPCAQYVPLATDGDRGPCQGEFDYQEFVCSLDGCDAGGGINEDVGCTFVKICADMPLRQIECDATTCTCFIEKEPFATCPVEDACVEVYETAKRAGECCDF